MSYRIYDTGTSDITLYDNLDDAIRVVDQELTKEELHGRIVDREREGRWAIYDGFVIKMLWIETDNGSVVSFARHRSSPKIDVTSIQKRRIEQPLEQYAVG